MRGELRPHDKDQAIARLAETQHGVVARGQLLEIGLKSGTIDRAVRAGRLHPLYRGVYAVGHRVLSRAGRWVAAVLACGADAVLSHHSAAAHWGIRDHTRESIDVTTRARGRSEGPIRRHHIPLATDEVTVHDNIPVTTVPRTIFDLAAGSPQAVEPALRQAEYLRLYDSLSLLDLLERYPGHRGNRAVRSALAHLEETPGRTRSIFEERFIAFLDAYDLPRPHFNAWLTVGADRYQADCLWPDQRLIVELDSWSAHGTRSAFRNDKARDRKLAVAGYTTTRIPWTALDDEPAAIASDLRQLLGRSPAEHT